MRNKWKNLFWMKGRHLWLRQLCGVSRLCFRVGVLEELLSARRTDGSYGHRCKWDGNQDPRLKTGSSLSRRSVVVMVEERSWKRRSILSHIQLEILLCQAMTKGWCKHVCYQHQDVNKSHMQTLVASVWTLIIYLAGAEKSPQRSEVGLDWTTVLELLLSSSNRQPERKERRDEVTHELTQISLKPEAHWKKNIN